MTSTTPHAHPVILFDGVCNLCNGFVQFAIQHDPKARLRFAALQSEAGQRLLTDFGLAGQPLKTVFLIEGKRIYRKSSAGLRALYHFGGAWRLLYVLMLIPSPIRNLVYDWIARNRYRWFGQRETCWMPTPDLQQRFL